MTQVFSASGEAHGVTVVDAASNVVVQVKTETKDGYEAIQIGFGNRKQVNKPQRGHMQDLGQFEVLREVRVPSASEYEVGQKLGVELFEPGDLVDATSKSGEDYELLENMHNALLGQWRREMGHVANVVGGVERINLRFGDADRRFHPIDAARQREAIAFLNENAFATPELFLSADVLGRIEASGVADRVLQVQRSVLGSLIAEARIKRMSELSQLAGGETYTAAEMLGDVTAGIWSELASGSPPLSG